MKFSKNIIYLGVVSGLLLCSAATTHYLKSSGSHAGSTGAPGDQTCARSTCHTSFQPQPAPAWRHQFVFPNNNRYVAGQSYPISLSVIDTGITRFGFEIVALDTLNKNQGTWTITDASRTHTLSHTVSGNMRLGVTHSSTGTLPVPSAGQNTWTFTYNAPSTYNGKITFYFATLSANFNNSQSGDKTFTDSLSIYPEGFGIEEWVKGGKINSSYIPGKNSVQIQFNAAKQSEIGLQVIDLQGKNVAMMPKQSSAIGFNTLQFALPNALPTGIYILQIQVAKNIISQKIMVY